VFSAEYTDHVNMRNPRWREKRALTFALSSGRDCVLPFLPAQQADHLHYGNLGHESPLLDLVPLHATTHKVVTALRRIPMVKPFLNLYLMISYLACMIIVTPLNFISGFAFGFSRGSRKAGRQAIFLAVTLGFVYVDYSVIMAGPRLIIHLLSGIHV
jgi:hypothetical protein